MTLSYSNHTRIILAVAVIVVVSIILVVFIVIPLLKTLGETNEAIIRNEQEIGRIETEIASYEALSAKFAKAGAERQVLARMFPIREEMVEVVEGVESAVGRAGLFSELSIYDKESQESSQAKGAKGSTKTLILGLTKIEEVPYVLELAGNDYRQFVNFLLYLENPPFFTEFSKFSLVADSLQAEGETLRNTGTATSRLEAVFFIKRP